jgi:hypothetical protein
MATPKHPADAKKPAAPAESTISPPQIEEIREGDLDQVAGAGCEDSCHLTCIPPTTKGQLA